MLQNVQYIISEFVLPTVAIDNDGVCGKTVVDYEFGAGVKPCHNISAAERVLETV
jgi:hypothetical protein